MKEAESAQLREDTEVVSGPEGLVSTKQSLAALCPIP